MAMREMARDHFRLSRVQAQSLRDDCSSCLLTTVRAALSSEGSECLSDNALDVSRVSAVSKDCYLAKE
jgi:hypothetical protein